MTSTPKLLAPHLRQRVDLPTGAEHVALAREDHHPRPAVVDDGAARRGEIAREPVAVVGGALVQDLDREDIAVGQHAYVAMGGRARQVVFSGVRFRERYRGRVAAAGRGRTSTWISTGSRGLPSPRSSHSAVPPRKAPSVTPSAAGALRSKAPRSEVDTHVPQKELVAEEWGHPGRARERLDAPVVHAERDDVQAGQAARRRRWRARARRADSDPCPRRVSGSTPCGPR